MELAKSHGMAVVINEDGIVNTDPKLALRGPHAKKVTASVGKMASGLLKAGAQAFVNGRVSEEVRNERYETCKACPFFIKDSKRCSECGCFMEAKTWIGGNPDALCPKQKWSR